MSGKPQKEEYSAYFQQYIDLVKEENITDALTNNLEKTLSFLQSISEEKSFYRYADGKWNIKEVLIHITDTERIFAYRALRFSRKDDTPLPGYDQNIYITNAGAEIRSWNSIINEFNAVRMATIELFSSFTSEALLQKSIANKNPISVNAIGFVIAGHEIHHINVIKNKYLSNN
jgi:uncharacterized damage-inducible protein DinB